MDPIILSYPVVLEPDTNGTLLVRCRDIPEAVTFGDDRVDALTRAADAIGAVLSVVYLRQGRAVPQPSPPGTGEELVEVELAAR